MHTKLNKLFCLQFWPWIYVSQRVLRHVSKMLIGMLSFLTVASDLKLGPF